LPGCHEQVARPLRLARCNGGDGLRERVLFARHLNDQGFHGLPSSSGVAVEVDEELRQRDESQRKRQVASVLVVALLVGQVRV
jgi:hypothetical protein